LFVRELVGTKADIGLARVKECQAFGTFAVELGWSRWTSRSDNVGDTSVGCRGGLISDFGYQEFEGLLSFYEGLLSFYLSSRHFGEFLFQKGDTLFAFFVHHGKE
jgi:hypothetical protein